MNITAVVRSLEHIRTSLTGPTTYQRLDAVASELTRIGLAVTKDIENAFISAMNTEFSVA